MYNAKSHMPPNNVVNKKRLRACVLANFFILICVIFCIILFDDHKSKYWRWGPHPDFILISTVIDNWNSYGILLLFVAFLIHNLIASSAACEP